MTLPCKDRLGKGSRESVKVWDGGRGGRGGEGKRERETKTNQLRQDPVLPSHLVRLIVVDSVGPVLVVLEEDRSRQLGSERIARGLNRTKTETRQDFVRKHEASKTPRDDESGW